MGLISAAPHVWNCYEDERKSCKKTIPGTCVSRHLSSLAISNALSIMELRLYILLKFFSQSFLCLGANRPLFAWLKAFSHYLWPTECGPYVFLFNGLNTTVRSKNVRDLTHCLSTDSNLYPPKSRIGKSMIVSRFTCFKSPVLPLIPPPGVKALLTLLSKLWGCVTGWEGPTVSNKSHGLCRAGDDYCRNPYWGLICRGVMHLYILQI